MEDGRDGVPLRTARFRLPGDTAARTLYPAGRGRKPAGCLAVLSAGHTGHRCQERAGNRFHPLPGQVSALFLPETELLAVLRVLPPRTAFYPGAWQQQAGIRDQRCMLLLQPRSALLHLPHGGRRAARHAGDGSFTRVRRHVSIATVCLVPPVHVYLSPRDEETGQEIRRGRHACQAGAVENRHGYIRGIHGIGGERCFPRLSDRFS